MIEQNAVIAIVRSSAIVGAVSRALQVAERSAQASATRSIWASLTGGWRRFDRAVQLRAIGVALVAAVIVHAGMMVLRPMPGWRAFVVPAVALAQGLLLIMVSSGSRSNS
jgi:hypothetical protein